MILHHGNDKLPSPTPRLSCPSPLCLAMAPHSGQEPCFKAVGDQWQGGGETPDSASSTYQPSLRFLQQPLVGSDAVCARCPPWSTHTNSSGAPSIFLQLLLTFGSCLFFLFLFQLSGRWLVPHSWIAVLARTKLSGHLVLVPSEA